MLNNTCLLIAFSLFITMGCRPSEEKDTIEVKRIQYDVMIKNDDPTALWWANNLEGSVREEVLGELFQKAYSGEIQVYDYFMNPLTPQQVRKIGSDTIYKTMMREYPPYEEFDTMVVTSISIRDISALRFLEEWKIDRLDLSVDKRVVGLGPVYLRKYGEEQYKELLFWTYFDSEYPGRLKQN